MKRQTVFQDYLGEYYSERKKKLYYEPKLTNPLGKFAKEMFNLLEKNDIIKIQEKARELQERIGKNNSFTKKIEKKQDINEYLTELTEEASKKIEEA